MSTIIELENYFGCSIPKTYKHHLLNLGEVSEEQVHLYPMSYIIERNECYETKEYAPGYINIGDDGGGKAFLLSLKEEDPEVIVIDHGCMDPEMSESVCISFSQWVKTGYIYDDE